MAGKSTSAATALGLASKIHCVLAVLLLGMMIAACQQLVTKVDPAVEQVDLPQGLYVPEDGAVAFRVRAAHGKLVRGVELPLAPLLKHGVETRAGFLVYTLSNGRYRVIAHRELGDKVVADLIGGKTYVLARRLTGRVALSLGALCKWRFEENRRPSIDIPRICTQILCVPELFSEQIFFEKYGVPNDGAPPLEFGGWDVIPRDLCRQCTRTTGTPADLGTPVFACLSPPGAACANGQVLFNADFEAETVGSPPSTSPAGPPPGDSLPVSGDVTVVSTTSNAARLRRGSNSPAVLGAVPDTNATSTGSYCIRFTGQMIGTSFSPAIITLFSTNDSVAWRLVVDEESAVLTSGALSTLIEVEDFTTARQFRFDVDLDLQVFDMFIDGNLVASGLPFLDSSFDVIDKLEFMLGVCILECFESNWIVDDIRITKTD